MSDKGDEERAHQARLRDPELAAIVREIRREPKIMAQIETLKTIGNPEVVRERILWKLAEAWRGHYREKWARLSK